MANETTYINLGAGTVTMEAVYEAVTFYAQQNFFMPTLVQTFTDFSGMQPRKGSVYGAGTVATSLGETDDLDDQRQAVTRSLDYTLTPSEAGTQFAVTDRRLDSDDAMIIQDIVTHFGYTMFKQVESDLLSTFSSLTGGTIGSAGGTLTWGSIYDAAAIMRANGIPAPYYCVLHEYQYRRLAQSANVAGLTNAAPLTIRDNIQTNYLVQNIGGGIFLYTTGVSTAGTATVSGLFSQMAIGYDVRRGLRLEAERDASARHTEWNGTHIYATGVLKANYGVQLIGDASTPS